VSLTYYLIRQLPSVSRPLE